MAKRAFTLDASSQLTNDATAAFISGSVEEDLRSVPGIGPANKTALVAAGVETTYQLLGKFLMLKTPDMGIKEHCDAFYLWLAEVKVNSHRAGVTRVIAEKANAFMPGLFDESAFEDESAGSK